MLEDAAGHLVDLVRRPQRQARLLEDVPADVAASESPSPREIMERSLAGIDEETVGKVLQHTATKLYNLDPPDRG